VSFDFTLPLRQPDSPTETITFLVEWGDGQSEVITLEGGNNWNPAIYSHSYATDPAKTIKIYPLIGETFGKYWNFGDQTADRLKLTNISAWGSFQFDRSGGAFEGCSNLSFSSGGGSPSFGPAGDPPNSPNNALARAFKGCSSLSPNANALAGWGPSLVNVNSLSETFSGCLNLNLNLDNWTVSNVRTTYRMFYNCPSINQSFAGWTNVSNLENMSEMFSGATNFAGEIFANWDSTSFSDGSNKTSSDISGMFKGTKFNGANVSTWDVSNISNFSSVFEGATLFTDQLGGLHDWDTGEGTNFYNMFNGATSFNRDISQWDTSKGTNFNSMFQGASIFNQNINTGAEINKHGGLYNPWTIRSDVAVTMDNMLNGASAFDQDISDWDVANISSATNLLTGTNLSVANALEINDSSTGWPSQGGASAAVTNESAAAVQASGTIPVITSHTAAGGTIISNPENTQTIVNLVATGSPVPTFSTAGGGDVSKFSLINTGDGEATLKLSPVPDFENPTDTSASGSNTYGINISASNAIGSNTHFFNFNVTDVADVAAPAVSNAGIPAGNEPSPTWAYFGWTSAGEGVKYKYQLASDAGFTSLLINQSSGSHIPTYATTGGYVTLSPETTYYFRVRAAHGAAYEVDGPWTTWSIVTADATFAPTWVDRGSGATVTQLIDQSSNPNQWSTYYDNDENTIETVSFEAAGTPTPSFSIKTGAYYDGDMFTVVDNGDGTGLIKLTNPIDYENRPWNYAYGKNHYSAIVVAENTHNNNSTIETIFTVFPKNVSDVAAPAINTLSLSNATYDGFIANWDSIGAGYTYHYQVATDSGFSNIINDIDNYSGLEVEQVSLAAGTTYYFRVKANGQGVGSTYEVDSPSWGSASIDTVHQPATAAEHEANLTSAGATIVKVEASWPEILPGRDEEGRTLKITNRHSGQVAITFNSGSRAGESVIVNGWQTYETVVGTSTANGDIAGDVTIVSGADGEAFRLQGSYVFMHVKLSGGGPDLTKMISVLDDIFDNHPTSVNYTYLPSSGTHSEVFATVDLTDFIGGQYVTDWYNFLGGNKFLKSVTWDHNYPLVTSEAWRTSDMFDNCEHMDLLQRVSNWDMSNVQNASGMFDNCGELGGRHWGACPNTKENDAELPYSSGTPRTMGFEYWDVSKVDDFRHFMAYCNNFPKAQLHLMAQHWNPVELLDTTNSSADAARMFYNICHYSEDSGTYAYDGNKVDFSHWDFNHIGAYNKTEWLYDYHKTWLLAPTGGPANWYP
jgi:hypothetical protein